MRILKKISTTVTQRWNAVRITSKFSLAFGLMLVILLMQTIIAYVALSITWESHDTIQGSSEVQRLVMVMSRDWETVQRLRERYFVHASIVGANQAYQRYALPASGKIAEVVRDGAKLQYLTNQGGSSLNPAGQNPELTLVLSNIRQYATIFEQATALETQLTAKTSGYHDRLVQSANALAAASA